MKEELRALRPEQLEMVQVQPIAPATTKAPERSQVKVNQMAVKAGDSKSTSSPTRASKPKRATVTYQTQRNVLDQKMTRRATQRADTQALPVLEPPPELEAERSELQTLQEHIAREETRTRESADRTEVLIATLEKALNSTKCRRCCFEVNELDKCTRPG